MKILHITSAYLPAYQRGGPVHSIHNLCKELASIGHEITVFTTNKSLWERKDIRLFEETYIDGVRVIYCRALGRCRYSYPKGLLDLMQNSIGKYQLIHIHGVYSFSFLIASMVARKNGVPYIITPRGMLMSDAVEKKSKMRKNIYIRVIAKRILEGASGMHFTSNMEKERTLELGIHPQKSIIIPNGVEIPGIETVEAGIFKKKYGLEDKKIVLFLSRINWKKGLDILIPAFAKALRECECAHLVIAGPDEEGYGKKVRKWIDENEITNHVTLTGLVKGKEKLSALVDADVFALTSYSENFGMAPVEAMLAGKPVIISKQVGISEFIENGKEGIIIENKIEEIANAIMRLLQNEEERKIIAENGMRLAKRCFSPRETAEKMARFYESVLGLSSR